MRSHSRAGRRAGRRAFLGLGAALLACVLAVQPAEAKQIAPAAKSGAGMLAGLAPTGVSGWMVVDLDSGEVVDQRNADRGFAPASVSKLPTAAFVLDALGPEHVFETRVLATGPIKDGRVDGDLILQGGGDPELDTDALVPLVEALKAAGVQSVAGALIADGTALPQVSQITPMQEVYAAYNPSVSALDLNFNRVHVVWDARSGHDSLTVEAESDSMSPEVDIIGVSLSSDPDAPVFSFAERDGRELWQMARRAYRGRAARWLPVKRPEIYAGEVFRQLAGGAGISLPPPTLGRTPDDARVLAVHRSRPVGDILREMLKHSTNLTAEVTGTAATRTSGIGARTLADSAAVMDTWAAAVAGFPAGDPGFRFVNHSGLTLETRVSPRRLVELMTALARRPSARTDHGLPGGVAAYLRPYSVDDKRVPLDYDHLEIAAKTGTMSYVRGLAGYISTPRGHRLVFAVFSNDLETRGTGPERIDHHWMGRARAFERALIRDWIVRVDGG